ncbi:N-formylglutamate amidohydrolase [Roseovarius tolerans]|uniref:N-formylglutamate amidohydrolase n=1 Tax=Roseovarius tolerans TaxID=74031 RepID=A0A0L6CRY2_9RHOB|nr:N-formylglutamate deformylase [Roseovarius tolerans]KNX40451.1 N-formylglutamate amidohydrolase [Roseovarius tolerans]
MIEVVQGGGPLVLGLPHTGTYVPPEIEARLNARGRALADTDWHIERLYDGLVSDVTTVRTPVHRYVIDVNRSPDGESLYPGQNTTGLVPLTDFDGLPIWRDGEVPDADEVEERRVAYHASYHAALAAEMERLRARHGFAILYDCHSIRSRIPFLFDGVLPDLNIGTNGGATCASGIAAAVEAVCRKADGYTSVTNGRFKGGWTTRHYGRPDEGLHAIQMELAQSAYLAAEAPPWTYDENRAETLRATLRTILETLSAWRP